MHVDDGHGEQDLLNLIVEIKGYRGEDAKEKKNTRQTYWVPGVNRLGQYGRWAFAEFTDVYAMEKDFGEIVEATFAEMIESARGASFKPWTVTMNRSLQRMSASVRTQPWVAQTVEALWSLVGGRKSRSLTLPDLEAIASASGRSTNEAFSILSMLTGDEPGLLALRFESGDAHVPLSREEVFRQLRQRLAESAPSDGGWRAWAAGIRVFWEAVPVRGSK